MAVVDPIDNDVERFVAQHRGRPDAYGQRWHDEMAFDNAADLQAFLAAKRAEESPDKASSDWRPALRPVGYDRDQSDRHQLKRAFEHGVRPTADVRSRLANEVVTATQQRPE